MDQTKTSFSISLEHVNSVFGISAATLRALADSHGVTEEAIILRALTEWAKKEIPDLDLDSPDLSEKQIQTLLERRRAITNSQVSEPSLLDLYKAAINEPGAGHEEAKLVSDNGTDS